MYRIFSKLTPLLLALFLLSSCSKKILRLQMDYVSRENLASYHVGTPDRQLICPPVGQRMLISWYIPQKEFIPNETQIKVSLVYGNHTEEEFWITPKNFCSMYVHYLLNENYFEKCGILTYRAKMYQCGQLVKCWKHHLWTEIISFEEEKIVDYD